MSRPLRLVLIGLVLLDLGFVYITEAASTQWLALLALLTVLSPVLLRYRERMLYRIAWNGAVVAVFTVLVHHATSGGVRFLLEDGLLLAALCQVHLLNNIGPDQKPDLLFFNSFLVPVVTCFLSMDLAYLVLFTVYAPLLLLGLSLHVLTREGRPWSPALMFSVGRGAAARAVVVMGITLLVFFFFPRDFQRKGLLGRSISFQPGFLQQTGYTEEIDLERSGIMGPGGDRVVMTVTAPEGEGADIPEYWRGRTLGRFDGRGWHPVRAEPDPNAWNRDAWTREGREGGATLAVDLRAMHANRIFLPPSARRIRTAKPSEVYDFLPLNDNSVVRRRSGGTRIRYEVTTGAAASTAPVERKHDRTVYVLVQTGTMPDALRGLTRKLRKELDPRAGRSRIVEHLRRWLQENRDYLPPGAAGAARSLKEFVRGDSGAHCEFFATALALMIRSEGIPARFVAGYRSTERDVDGRTLVVRDRNAHAWVEVFDEKTGWYTVDATPAGDFDTTGGDGPFAAVGAAFRNLWDSVTGFDGEGRSKALSWLWNLPGNLWAAVRNHPVRCGAIVLLLAGLLVARRRKPRENRIVREYRRAVRWAGLTFRTGETPRELLERARIMAIAPKKFDRVQRATEGHEAARYRVP